MGKPTIFFSHSTKDKQAIMAIKNRLNEITGSTLDIFLSSDGQSIPFGTNWVHEIESGLVNSKIMFLFVTPQSILSNWIYFEAGFAYSKGIKVVPVGFGVDITSIKAPLNLLQGFNILSADSLSNIISIINKEFDYKFNGKFTDEDMDYYFKSLDGQTSYDLGQYIDYIHFHQHNWYSNNRGIHLQRFNELYFNNIIGYLSKNSIEYSFENNYYSGDTKCVLVKGMLIQLKLPTDESERRYISDEGGSLQIKISTYDLSNSMNLFFTLIKECLENNPIQISLYPSSDSDFVIGEERVSSLLSRSKKAFSPHPNEIGAFTYKKSGIDFQTDEGIGPVFINPRINIRFQEKDVYSNDFIRMLNDLIDIGVIVKGKINEGRTRRNI